MPDTQGRLAGLPKDREVDELKTMRQILRALERLSEEARVRVVRYLTSRFPAA